jgi:hypothetical protein
MEIMNDRPTYEMLADMRYRLLLAERELADWRILTGWGGTPEIINDFINGQQARIHYAQNLEDELAAVTEQRDECLIELEIVTERLKGQRHPDDNGMRYEGEIDIKSVTE